MAMSFDELVNNMVNVSLGAAAMAADKGKELIDDLSARGAQARSDASQGDFARSMADVFKQAGGAVSDVTDRLSEQGATVAERILDELIVARVRPMTKAERTGFLAHVRDIVDSADDATVSVKVEAVEVDGDAEAEGDAPAADGGEQTEE